MSRHATWWTGPVMHGYGHTVMVMDWCNCDRSGCFYGKIGTRSSHVDDNTSNFFNDSTSSSNLVKIIIFEWIYFYPTSLITINHRQRRKYRKLLFTKLASICHSNPAQSYPIALPHYRVSFSPFVGTKRMLPLVAPCSYCYIKLHSIKMLSQQRKLRNTTTRNNIRDFFTLAPSW